MTYERFPWSRVTLLEALKELSDRNIWWELETDSGLKCLSCKKPCQKGQKCYFPSRGVNTKTNKTIAHVSCVDSAKSGALAEGKRRDKVAQAKKSEAPGVLKIAGPLDVQEHIKRLVDEAYRRGEEAGYRKAYTELEAVVLNEDLDPND